MDPTLPYLSGSQAATRHSFAAEWCRKSFPCHLKQPHFLIRPPQDPVKQANKGDVTAEISACWCKYKKKSKKHNSYHFTREQTIIEDSPDSPAFSMADSGGEVVVCCQASASTGGNQRLYPGYSLHAPWLLVFHNGKEGETANRIYPEHRYRCSNSIRPATSYLVFTAPASYCIITFRSGPPSSSALWTDSNAPTK